MFEKFLEEAGFLVKGQKDSGLLVQSKLVSQQIFIEESLVKGFSEFSSNLESAEPYPGIGSLVSRSWREQALIQVGDGIRRPPRPGGYRFGSESDSGACKLDRCSDQFYWRLVVVAFDREEPELFYPSGQGPIPIDYVIRRPITITVSNLESSDFSDSVRRSDPIIQACLFEMAYLFDVGYETTNDLFRRRARRRYRTSPAVASSELQTPGGQYNSDIVRFYIRAIANSDPVNQYLSFYHVLEYFFLRRSDNELYEKLKSRLLVPGFRPRPAGLDRIIQDVVSHKRETDETEMLKLVLKKYIDAADLTSFLTKYEVELGENLFSSSCALFGETFKTNFAPQHVLTDLAKRIKYVRNALVHSSDRHERVERYIPSLASEERLRKEIPLLRYLAEKVIVGSAEPIA